jgi:hypothetical protein
MKKQGLKGARLGYTKELGRIGIKSVTEQIIYKLAVDYFKLSM